MRPWGRNVIPSPRIPTLSIHVAGAVSKIKYRRQQNKHWPTDIHCPGSWGKGMKTKLSSAYARVGKGGYIDQCMNQLPVTTHWSNDHFSWKIHLTVYFANRIQLSV